MGRRYSIGGPWVLRGIDLDLPGGALVRVEGVNGTGKSTLLRLLAGIDAPTEGRVTGRPRTAYVPERFPAALPFTALGYLTHLGRIHGLPRRTAKERAGQWLERFGAAAHAGTPLAELSKGTSQKVAVAQALLAEPALLVLDEAWTGLDTEARTELDRAVHERVAAGATVVFVDHDPKRLSGGEDARYAVVGAGLKRVPLNDVGLSSVGPDRVAPGRVGPSHVGPDHVVPSCMAPIHVAPIHVAPTHGAETLLVDIVGSAPLPARLPGAPEELEAPDGIRTLRVAAAHSDDLLRALLAARPPWHIQGVRSQ
ncbi:ATP-binding cassette domain-containing protein [Streptomyces violascens]|uniref:ABC transporter ATP-binding protein n=1 Tax=Streptomyces violascens TaxID=67381 RepID=A0ABQ3QYB3_9ACTN|nr:ATP-binding cassette domain-containing protein [Streptomyces violascens]GGU22888.1 ABC transporter ATP-binding protein [Streptomyces violascens]GHI42267.1 ABC transporter ATP-binding protein [Streptomyces violascens]